MTLPRSSLVSPETTPYYHCISRCVRRAFLCGRDTVTGYSFEHRRDWIIERLAKLSSIFAIEVCAYAIMSNHHHLVLKLEPETARSWTMDTVLRRWSALFKGPLVVQQYLDGVEPGAGEQDQLERLARIYRARLCDLSWFMRCLNEPIARWANAEDGCTGRFWEGRYKSQALLDEQALLSCMAYVDLNPVRAGLADTPEASEFTSIRQRILDSTENDAAAQPTPEPAKHTGDSSTEASLPDLIGFASGLSAEADNQGLPFALSDYLELVDWSGRAIHPDKKGSIAEQAPPILERLEIDSDALLQYLGRRERGFYHVIGRQPSIRQAALELGRRFLKGASLANQLFHPRIA